jgi:hypothetical protein
MKSLSSLKAYAIVIVLIIGFSNLLKAQVVLSDSINLGEDRLSHGMQEYNPGGGNSIKVGFYDCNGDSGIAIGGNNQYDSIVFTLNVVPNVDKVRINWVFSWFNHANDSTRIVVENDFEKSLYGLGAPAVGSSPLGCDKSTHFLDFEGLSSYTADGKIKIKVYDPGVGFAGNCTMTWMEVLSVISGSVAVDNYGLIADAIKIYPNPADNLLKIDIPQFNTTTTLSITNANGQMIASRLLDNASADETSLDLSSYDNGIYFYSISNQEFNHYGKFVIKH